jgi:hypothetical protein
LLQLPMQTTMKTRAWFATLQVLSVPLSSKPSILSSFWLKWTFSLIDIPSNKRQQYHTYSAESAPSYGVGSCDAETELHDNVILFSCFPSGVVKSVWQKWFLHTYCIYSFLASSILKGRQILWAHKWAL